MVNEFVYRRVAEFGECIFTTAFPFGKSQFLRRLFQHDVAELVADILRDCHLTTFTSFYTPKYDLITYPVKGAARRQGTVSAHRRQNCVAVLLELVDDFLRFFRLPAFVVVPDADPVSLPVPVPPGAGWRCGARLGLSVLGACFGTSGLFFVGSLGVGLV